MIVGCLHIFPKEIVWNTLTAYIDMTKLVQGTKASDDGRAVTCPGRSMRYEINFKNNAICIAWGLARPVAPFNVENSIFSGLSPKHSTTLEGASVCEHLFEVNFVPGGSMFHGQLACRIDFVVAHGSKLRHVNAWPGPVARAEE